MPKFIPTAVLNILNMHFNNKNAFSTKGVFILGKISDTLKTDMEIYIEYAFLENFFYDFILLCLAFLATKRKPYLGRTVFSAVLGGLFALLFPLIGVYGVFFVLLKISVGMLLCMVAFGRLKTKKEWGRYALTTVFFFCFSFGFGGTLLGVYGVLPQKIPSIAVFFGFLLLSAGAIWLIRRLYAQKRAFQGVYPCKITAGGRTIRADGFFDSGNIAQKNGIPVCFVSADLFYEIYKDGGQVCDEMRIHTLSGKKIVRLYAGEIEVRSTKMQVYFTPSGNMIGRNYKILLNSACIGEADETHGMD